MKWRFFFLLMWPVALVADPVSIRSGEHDTFSRLVMSIGIETDWSVTANETGFELELTGRAEGFEVAQIFERIPRDRLIDVTQTSPTTLQLEVDCPCDIDAFIWQPGELVVDIVDGSETIEPDTPPVIDLRIADAPLIDAPSDPSLEFPNFLQLTPSTPMTEVTKDTPETEGTDLNIAMTETALAEGIARAASQGFLTPIDADLPERVVVEPPVIEEPIAPPPPVNPNIVARPGIDISTALDRELAQLGVTLEQTIDQQCLAADLFEIETWGDERDFHDQASALAEALAGEFGQEPLDAQNTLARLYIHFGFGAEARSVLAADPALSQSRRVLVELAGIIDEYEGDYPLIQAQTGCETSGALWAFLIEPTEQENDARNQLIQHFLALPRPLRGQMSPRLARRFIEIGDHDAAGRLLRAAENNDAEAVHDVQATRALLAEDQNDTAGAVAVLTQEARDNARTTPDSLIRLIDLQLSQETSPEEADLLTMAAMRQEHRGTDVAVSLANTEAMGRIAIDQYQAALDIVKDRDDADANAIVDHVYKTMAVRGDAAIFLEFVFGELPASLTPTTENAIAARLIDLGFAERASLFLQGPANRNAAADRRYLLAQVANANGEYFAAIDALLGMTDDRARALRARAYEGLGEHRAALEALTPDQSASTPTLQFRASAWDRLAVENDAVLSEFAQAVLTPPNTDPVESLSDRRALLSHSQESRRAVEDLLLRFDGTTERD